MRKKFIGWMEAPRVPDASVILFLASGTYSRPIDLGGKGISWQNVAAQESSSGGDQVLFQIQEEMISS
jgi:hypothetical protein